MEKKTCVVNNICHGMKKKIGLWLEVKLLLPSSASYCSFKKFIKEKKNGIIKKKNMVINENSDNRSVFHVNDFCYKQHIHIV